MSKFSVKKPFTVLVGIVIAVVLGVVSMLNMQLDLLPEISLPYLMVITTYPGASAEKIEMEICEPMEASLGTINGVKNVTSVCNENYGLVQLEFQDDIELDSAMVKVSSALNTLQPYLPEDAGTPSIIELSTDMMASVYLAVGMEGKEMDELSQFIEDDITPQFEKQNGVASVSTLGLVDKSIHVELNQEKVDALNESVSLEYRNEISGRDYVTRGIDPADKRFRTHDVIRCHVPLGLQIRFELVLLKSLMHPRLDTFLFTRLFHQLLTVFGFEVVSKTRGDRFTCEVRLIDHVGDRLFFVPDVIYTRLELDRVFHTDLFGRL